MATAILTWTMDDSEPSQRLIVAPYLAKLGLKANFGLIYGEHVGANAYGAGGTDRFMNLTQARELQDLYRHACLSHAPTITDHDNTSMSAVQLETAMLTARLLGISQGFKAANHLVLGPYTPLYGAGATAGGATGVDTFRIARKYYSSALTFVLSQTSGTAAAPKGTLRPFDTMRLQTVGFNAGHTSAQVIARIDEAVARKQALHLRNHGVVASSASGLYVLTSTFTAIADYIASKVTAGTLVVKTLPEFLGC